MQQHAALRAFTDAAAERVGQTIADLRHEAQRERMLREAEHRARLAELETRLASAADLERQLQHRLAALKDGAPGADGKDGEAGRDGSPGADGNDGRDGADGLVGEPGAPGERGAEGPSGKDGPAGRDGADGVGVAEIRRSEGGRTLLVLTDEREIDLGVLQGSDGANGRDGEAGATGEQGLPGKDGADGRDGEPGERGPEGAPGKLISVRAWQDGVHYEGDVVTLDGSTFQAVRDTGKSPPHEDWALLARAGRDGVDGRSFVVRGTFDETAEYSALDVVALNGACFAARRDAPGSCPGDGWQMLASQGKRGGQGERGMPGAKGDRGEAGSPVVALSVDEQGLLILTNGDGSTVTCDLYPLLSNMLG